MVKAAIAILVIAAAARADTEFAGSRACAGCHRTIYDRFRQTAMGRSMSPASDPGQLALAPKPVQIRTGNRTYEVWREGSDLFQAESGTDASGAVGFRTKHKLEYAIGSGVNGVTYVVRRGEHLFQAPLSYYSRPAKWDLSPGYELTDRGFSRPVFEACVVCHSGRPQPIQGREAQFADPPFAELAVGCENCHGPGRAHAAKPSRDSIVNPKRLPARVAEDICMYCHQGGDSRVLLPGRQYGDFRPGEWLNRTVAIFKIPLKPENAARDSDLLEHHFSMKLSRCYTASGGKLSCLTCHSPHGMPAQSDTAAYYRSKCLTCHTRQSCTAPIASRGPQDDCAGCHMPKRDVARISHSALSNHRIVRLAGESLPAQAYSQTTPDLPDLIFLNAAAGERSALPRQVLMLAYGELTEKEPSYVSKYLELLRESVKSDPANPVVLAAEGRRLLLMNTDESMRNAMDVLTRAVANGSTASTTFEDLAEVYARVGKLDDSIRTLQRGIEIAPFAPVLQKSLALRYIVQKRYAEAERTLERYVELFPEDDFVRGLLAKVRPVPSTR